jgi:hypothetical protein
MVYYCLRLNVNHKAKHNRISLPCNGGQAAGTSDRSIRSYCTRLRGIELHNIPIIVP